MEYRQLGNSGLKISAIGLGTNQFGGKVDQAGVNEIVAGALDLGINFIDTADIYQKGRSEETLGLALKGRWDQVVLATKVAMSMGPIAEVASIKKSPAVQMRRGFSWHAR